MSEAETGLDPTSTASSSGVISDPVSASASDCLVPWRKVVSSNLHKEQSALTCVCTTDSSQVIMRRQKFLSDRAQYFI